MQSFVDVGLSENAVSQKSNVNYLFIIYFPVNPMLNCYYVFPVERTIWISPLTHLAFLTQAFLIHAVPQEDAQNVHHSAMG